MTRVLILNERDPAHPKAGGAEVHVAEIFERLSARGLEVTLAACSFPGAPARDERNGLGIRRLGRLPFYYPRAASACRRATRSGHYDVVVECLNKLPFFAPLYSAVPVLALCHHLFGSTAYLQVSWPVAAAVAGAERLIPRLYRRERFVTISESSRDDLMRRGIGAERIEVHPPGTRQPRVAATPIAERGRRVVYVGRLEPYKRIDILVRAVAQLNARIPDIELAVVGRGSDRARLEGLVRELGIADRTRFTGFVADEDRDRLLAEARVCVCPSAKEGWGLTVIEANALGTPNVATDAPGLRDAVRDGETGFLVPEGDVAGFASHIALLLEDDDRATQLSKAARAWAANFDWDRCADQMQATLEAVQRQS